MHIDGINVFASNIIDKYKHLPDNPQSLCLADFASRHISKKIDCMPEPDDITIYTLPVSNTNALEPNPNTILLKIELHEILKCS